MVILKAQVSGGLAEAGGQHFNEDRGESEWPYGREALKRNLTSFRSRILSKNSLLRQMVALPWDFNLVPSCNSFLSLTSHLQNKYLQGIVSWSQFSRVLVPIIFVHTALLSLRAYRGGLVWVLKVLLAWLLNVPWYCSVPISLRLCRVWEQNPMLPFCSA